MADGYLINLLGENEHILFVTRQHWLVLFGEILSEMVIAAVLGGLVTLIWLFWLPDPLVPFGYLLLLLPAVSLLRDLLIWKNRQYVVTNWRVIQIAGVFNKEVSDSSLEKVNDVKLEQSFLGRLLGFFYRHYRVFGFSVCRLQTGQTVFSVSRREQNYVRELCHGEKRPLVGN